MRRKGFFDSPGSGFLCGGALGAGVIAHAEGDVGGAALAFCIALLLALYYWRR